MVVGFVSGHSDSFHVSKDALRTIGKDPRGSCRDAALRFPVDDPGKPVACKLSDAYNCSLFC